MTEERVGDGSPGGEVAVYEASNGEVALNVRLEQETVWLTRGQMAEVFRTGLDNISLHLKNVFADGELDRAATTEDFSVVRSEGHRRVRRAPTHYNLERISSLLFLLYLRQEGLRHDLNPQALTALTLLIAESAPANKDLLVRLIVNLLASPEA